MTAKDIISPLRSAESTPFNATVEANMPVVDVIPRLIDAPGRVLGVMEHGVPVGVIDESSLLDGLGTMFPVRDDCSVIEVVCAPADYSASLLTHAAEDVDVHVSALWTSPLPEGKLRVTMRLLCEDPMHVVRNLERYGFEVTSTYSRSDSELALAARRLEELQLYLSI